MVITGVWIAFGVLTLLLVLMRINKSCGKNIASLICNILTVVISFVIARIFVNSTAVNVGKVFMEFIEQVCWKYYCWCSDILYLLFYNFIYNVYYKTSYCL